MDQDIINALLQQQMNRPGGNLIGGIPGSQLPPGGVQAQTPLNPMQQQAQQPQQPNIGQQILSRILQQQMQQQQSNVIQPGE